MTLKFLKLKLLKGQSLIEVIVAIAILNIGLFSVWALFLNNYLGEREAEQRMVAVNLAREGLEIVRNIRDSNWLKVEDNTTDNGNPWFWDRNLNSGEYSVDYQNNEDLNSVDNARLYLNSDGFYVNDSTNNTITPYSRTITLRDICCADIDADLKCDTNDFILQNTINDNCAADGEIKIGVDVQAKVTWQIKNQTRQVIVQDQLFNWK